MDTFEPSQTERAPRSMATRFKNMKICKRRNFVIVRPVGVFWKLSFFVVEKPTSPGGKWLRRGRSTGSTKAHNTPVCKYCERVISWFCQRQIDVRTRAVLCHTRFIFKFMPAMFGRVIFKGLGHLTGRRLALIIEHKQIHENVWRSDRKSSLRLYRSHYIIHIDWRHLNV